MAAQQHDATLRRHYEHLLVLQNQSQSPPGSSLINVQTAASLQRLSHLLQTLERSLDGEHGERSEGQEDDQREGDREEEDREDWAVDREIEIARLEKENEELRKRLGIDTENTRKQGWDDKELEEHRPIISSLKASLALASLPDTWLQRNSPQLTPFTAGPVPGTATAMQQYPQQQQNQQQQQQQTVPLQLPPEFQSGMRAAGASSLRRPSIFGRGAAPIWDGSTLHERPWLQNHGGLDLAG